MVSIIKLDLVPVPLRLNQWILFTGMGGANNGMRGAWTLSDINAVGCNCNRTIFCSGACHCTFCRLSFAGMSFMTCVDRAQMMFGDPYFFASVIRLDPAVFFFEPIDCISLIQPANDFAVKGRLCPNV